MNKKFLIASLLFFIPIIGHTDDKSNRRFPLQRIGVETRSINVVIEAFIRGDILSISFDDSGTYSLYIEDDFNATVYSSILPADGMEYDFDLSCIGNGTFRIVLVGLNGEYEGYFTIY